MHKHVCVETHVILATSESKKNAKANPVSVRYEENAEKEIVIKT